MKKYFLISLLSFSLNVVAELSMPDEVSDVTTVEEDKIPAAAPLYHNRIIAVVNNDIITEYDLRLRLRMLTQGTENQVPADKLSSLKTTLLNQLVVETLKLQIIDRAGVLVTDQEIEDAISNTEQANHLPKGKIHQDMQALKIPVEVYTKHFKAQIGWIQYISRTNQHAAQVRDKDIEDAIKPETNKKRYLLSEIRLLFSDATQQKVAYKTALQLASQVSRGSSFAEMAQQISQSPSSINGGDIAWIAENQLPHGVVKILKSLPVGSITEPIQGNDSYTIYWLRDKIIPGESGALMMVARQLNIKLNPQEDLQAQLQALQTKVKAVKTCAEFDALADQLPKAELNIYNEAAFSSMSPDLQNALKDLEINKPSAGIINEEDNTAVFFMVCKRYESPIPPEEKEQISDALINRRLGLISEQKIRDLQRSSYIDIRI